METAVALLVGLFIGVGVYLILSDSLIRILLGIVVFSNGVNLLIFAAGRITREIPPFIAPDAYAADPNIANPLPQALILTAIVISFSIFAFLLVLVFRTYQALGSDRTTELNVAEPKGPLQPPRGY